MCMVRCSRSRVYCLILICYSHTSLVIRGDKDERAVVCSGDRTYDLKMADTSNLLLLVPGGKTPDQLTNSQDGSNLAHTQVWKSLKHTHTCVRNSCHDNRNCNAQVIIWHDGFDIVFSKCSILLPKSLSVHCQMARSQVCTPFKT